MIGAFVTLIPTPLKQRKRHIKPGDYIACWAVERDQEDEVLSIEDSEDTSFWNWSLPATIGSSYLPIVDTYPVDGDSKIRCVEEVLAVLLLRSHFPLSFCDSCLFII